MHQSQKALIGFAVAALLFGSMVASAPTAEKRAAGKTATRKKTPSVRLALKSHFTGLAGVSGEQKKQMETIWADFNAKMRALEIERQDKIKDVLTDTQKAELEQTVNAYYEARNKKARETRSKRAAQQKKGQKQ